MRTGIHNEFIPKPNCEKSTRAHWKYNYHMETNAQLVTVLLRKCA